MRRNKNNLCCTFLIACLILSLSSGFAYAEKVCIDKSFMKSMPKSSRALNVYIDEHLGELIFLIDKNDSSGYHAGLKLLSYFYMYSALPDNTNGQWRIQMLASFLSVYEDRFENELRQMQKSEIKSIIGLYDLRSYGLQVPNDYPEMKARLIEQRLLEK